MPGWQVISWVILALPLTVPLAAALWWETRSGHDTTASGWGSLAALGVVSMYLAFFAWYRGLSLAGIAGGCQVQQLQAVLRLLWSAILLSERVSVVTVMVRSSFLAPFFGRRAYEPCPRRKHRAALWPTGRIAGGRQADRR